MKIEVEVWPDFIMNAPVAFGLPQQGHISTIEKMLKEGATWGEIGKEIGWCAETAKEHYRWYVESLGVLFEKKKIKNESQRKKMKEYIEELLAQIDAMALAPSASLALLEATLAIFHRMKQEQVMQSTPVSHRIAIAAFLACDSKACIAISKLKRAFEKNISGKNITKARRALQIHHGTAHEKLDSLCNVCKVSDLEIIARAHQCTALLSETSAMPSSIAAASLYVAVRDDSKNRLTHNEIYRLTGCTEVTQRKLVNALLLMLAV